MEHLAKNKKCNLSATFLPKRKRVLNKLCVLNKPPATKKSKLDSLLDSQSCLPACFLDSQVYPFITLAVACHTHHFVQDTSPPSPLGLSLSPLSQSQTLSLSCPPQTSKCTCLHAYIMHTTHTSTQARKKKIDTKKKGPNWTPFWTASRLYLPVCWIHRYIHCSLPWLLLVSRIFDFVQDTSPPPSLGLSLSPLSQSQTLSLSCPPQTSKCTCLHAYIMHT